MNRWSTIAALAALSAASSATAALAGSNSGAVCRLYWQDGSGPGSTSRNSTSRAPRFVATVVGLRDFRGADVQITVKGLEGNVPENWQFQPGGPAEAGASISHNFQGAYPAAFSGVPYLADAQMRMYFRHNCCVSPEGTAEIWLESAGAGGVVRHPTVEYGLYTVTLDQAAGLPGDLTDPKGARGVCIALAYRIPCDDPANPRGPGVGLLDGEDRFDFAPAARGYSVLTWEVADICRCAPCEELHAGTWHRLRGFYGPGG